jgi:hypothetical protein
MQPQRLEPTVVVEVNEWIRHPPRRPSSNNESTDTGSGLATEGDAMDGNLEIARLVNLVGVGRVLASTNTPVLSLLFYLRLGLLLAVAYCDLKGFDAVLFVGRNGHRLTSPQASL